MHQFMDAADVDPAWELMQQGVVSDDPRLRETQERLAACHNAMGHPENGTLVPACDALDPWCDHLIVRDLRTDSVVGTYRLLPPDRATVAGGCYAGSEFDMSALNPIAGPAYIRIIATARSSGCSGPPSSGTWLPAGTTGSLAARQSRWPTAGFRRPVCGTRSPGNTCRRSPMRLRRTDRGSQTRTVRPFGQRCHLCSEATSDSGRGYAGPLPMTRSSTARTSSCCSICGDSVLGIASTSWGGRDERVATDLTLPTKLCSTPHAAEGGPTNGGHLGNALRRDPDPRVDGVRTRTVLLHRQPAADRATLVLPDARGPRDPARRTRLASRGPRARWRPARGQSHLLDRQSRPGGDVSPAGHGQTGSRGLADDRSIRPRLGHDLHRPGPAAVPTWGQARVGEVLRSGIGVLVAPEATTWCGAGMGRFRPAMFQAAIVPEPRYDRSPFVTAPRTVGPLWRQPSSVQIP